MPFVIGHCELMCPPKDKSLVYIDYENLLGIITIENGRLDLSSRNLFNSMAFFDVLDAINRKTQKANYTITTIQLSNNDLSALPQLLTNFQHLTQLYISFNRLRKITPSLSQLNHLEQLHLGNNCLQSIPPGIYNLPNLEVLLLSNNRITTLPDEISNMKSLKQLWLSGNDLKSLPESIEFLSNLKTLKLANNDLRPLPATLPNLKNLSFLDLSGNPNLLGMPNVSSWKMHKRPLIQSFFEQVTFLKNAFLNKLTFIALFRLKTKQSEETMETTQITDAGNSLFGSPRGPIRPTDNEITLALLIQIP